MRTYLAKSSTIIISSVPSVNTFDVRISIVRASACCNTCSTQFDAYLSFDIVTTFSAAIGSATSGSATSGSATSGHVSTHSACADGCTSMHRAGRAVRASRSIGSVGPARSLELACHRTDRPEHLRSALVVFDLIALRFVKLPRVPAIRERSSRHVYTKAERDLSIAGMYIQRQRASTRTLGPPSSARPVHQNGQISHETVAKQSQNHETVTKQSQKRS